MYLEFQPHKGPTETLVAIPALTDLMEFQPHKGPTETRGTQIGLIRTQWVPTPQGSD